MRTMIVGLAVAIGLGVASWYAWKSMRAVVARADAIADGVVARYVGLVSAGQLDEAWSTCLSVGLQEQVGLVDFVRAHEAHTLEHGALQGWTQTDYQHEADLFSSESLIGINGVLHYERRDVFVLYKVDSAVQPYRVQQIFGGADRSSLLSEGVW